MADSSVTVSGPVHVQSDAKERVAFDLMMAINSYSTVKADGKDKAYWLNLYSLCLSTVRGGSVSRILGGE